ncbi:MAG: methyltransferase domain-containing protein [Alphaproteobacteria bacterium]|nr:methyltransferase domain-containing protein [Alphaproteobacteria bacterium]
MTNAAQIAQRNEDLKDLIKAVKVDVSYCYETDKLLDEKVDFMAENCPRVLDFGKSSRHRYKKFSPEQAQTADINQYNDYPDYICDICDSSTFPEEKYDGIICNAVLEHVYDPFTAVKNLHEALKPEGYLLAYVPYLYRYHAPKDLTFQDYYRYSRDALAYMFRDFSSLTLYSVRGRTSTAFVSAFPFWKPYVEKKIPKANILVDKVLGGAYDPLQTSGYHIWAQK